MLITLENASKYYGARQVLRSITATINPKDRIGLIGANGAGKTTLLGLMSGELEPDTGAILRLPGLRVGYFHQSTEQVLSGSISEELRRPFSDVLAVKARLDEVAQRMAHKDEGSEEQRELTAEYDKLNTAFESGEGYLVDVKINTVAEGMGLSEFDRSMNSGQLSGGERTRLGLAQLLLTEPDMLILDEATNHLDFKMLAFLESWLASYKGALITVSHDRHYLNNVTNKTWELECGNLTTYPAAYNDYLPLKEQRNALAQKEYERYVSEKARLEDYVRRNIVRATTAGMAKSRMKMIEAMDEKSPPPPRPKPPHIRFSEKNRPVKDVLIVKGLSISVGEGGSRKRLIKNLDFTVARGERLAVIGPNGVGKSTLFASLSGRHKPDKGRIEWGSGTKVSYFTQDDGELCGNGTVIDFLWDKFPSQDAYTLRTLLGGVGIVGEDVYKPVAVLSGGEKAKVKLSVLALADSNVLLMDEPTNHLDIPAKERLEDALRDYPGTIIAVSHDRRFLTVIPTRILELSSEGGRIYEGSFEDYSVAKETEQEKPKPEKPPEDKRPTAYYRTKKQRSAQQALKAKIIRCEDEIAVREERIARIEQLLVTEGASHDYQKLMELTEELSRCRHEVDSLLERWEWLCTELESI